MLVVHHQVTNSQCIAVKEQLILLRVSVHVEVDDCVAKVVLTFLECKLEVIFNVRHDFVASICFIFAKQEVSFISRVSVCIVS